MASRWPICSSNAALGVLGVAVLALADMGCDAGSPRSKPTAASQFVVTGGPVPLWPVPDQVVHACRRAQATASFTVLCPARLPRATRGDLPWAPPLALDVTASGSNLDFSYGAAAGGLGQAETLAHDRPDRFLHFVVGLATEGVPPGARRARLGGRWGLLAPASSVLGYEGAPYFANHVRFVWRERGARYVATLHTFGQPATAELLGQIVASLTPASRLHVPVQLPDSGRVGSGPDALAANPAGLWVASTGTIATDLDGQLVRLNPVSLRPIVRPRIRPKEIRLAVGAGAVWTVGHDVTPDGQNDTPPELDRVDPRSGRVTARVSVGSGEATAIAAGTGSVWVALTGPYPDYRGTLLRIDAASMRIGHRTLVGRGPAALALDGSSVWAVNSASNTVSRVDANTGRLLATVPVGHHPIGIAVGAGSAWATNGADGSVSRIDGRSDRITATIIVGRAPYGVAADNRGVWVAMLGRGMLAHIDPGSDRVVGWVNLHGDPLAIASDGRFLYVTLNTDGRVVRLGPRELLH